MLWLSWHFIYICQTFVWIRQLLCLSFFFFPIFVEWTCYISAATACWRKWKLGTCLQYIVYICCAKKHFLSLSFQISKFKGIHIFHTTVLCMSRGGSKSTLIFFSSISTLPYIGTTYYTYGCTVYSKSCFVMFRLAYKKQLQIIQFRQFEN